MRAGVRARRGPLRGDVEVVPWCMPYVYRGAMCAR